jgi:hypothetical protein
LNDFKTLDVCDVKKGNDNKYENHIRTRKDVGFKVGAIIGSDVNIQNNVLTVNYVKLKLTSHTIIMQ